MRRGEDNENKSVKLKKIVVAERSLVEPSHRRG